MAATSATIRLFIADDHDLIRMGLKRLLADYKDINVIGEAGDCDETLKLVRSLAPDVVLVDINMPGGGGVEVTRRLSRVAKRSRIIILTALDGESYPNQLLKIGAMGYLTKGASAKELHDAITTVYSGKQYIAAVVAQKMALHKIRNHAEDPINSLSRRQFQIQIIQLIISGYKADDIAQNLHISTKTVSGHRNEAFRKLGVKSEIELARKSVEYGWVSLQPDKKE